MKKIVRNSITLFSPSFFSIIIGFFTLPIFLNYLGVFYYGQYVIQILIVSLGYLFNLGVEKLVIINSIKLRSYKKKCQIIIDYFIIHLFFSLTLIFFFYSILFILNHFYSFSTYKLINNFFIYSGIYLTSFFFFLESIFKIYFKYKLIAFFNFFFFFFSLNFSSVLLYFKSSIFDRLFKFNEYPNELIIILCIIRFLVILIMLFYVFNKKLLQIKNLSSSCKKFYFNKINDKILISLTDILILFYSYVDKILVKFFLGNVNLAFYSIAQQLAGKTSTIFSAFNSVYLPTISSLGYKNLIKHFLALSLTFNFIFLLLYTFLFLLTEDFLMLWLKNSYDPDLVIYTKLFCILVMCTSYNFLINATNERLLKSKKIFFLELIIFVIFFPIFLYSLKINNGIFIFITLLILKEIFCLSLKLFIFEIIKIKKLMLFIFFVFSVLILFCSIFYYVVNLISFFIMIFFFMMFYHKKHYLILYGYFKKI